MFIVSKALVGLIALGHVYFCYIEMFAWDTDRTKKLFSFMDAGLFSQTTQLAANQGLYNLFLATGLFWSLVIGSLEWQWNTALFFLTCVLVAGVYGYFSLGITITLKAQALPAAVAIATLLIWRKVA